MDVKQLQHDFRVLAGQCGFQHEVFAEVGGFELAALTKVAEGKPKVYLSSGMHGDEPAGVLAMCELLRDGAFHDEIEWRICPVVNPLGLAEGTRENAQGVDLNRDYLLRKTEEVSAHVAWLERQPVPEMFLSLHEDWESTGFYLYEIQKLGCPSSARAILSAAAEVIQTEPSSLIDDHEVREPGWIFHEPRADFPDEWPEAIYMAEQGVRVSYTLETPSSVDLDRRVACHKRAVCTAIEQLLLTREQAEGCNEEA